jgi:hypothetical protein
MQIFFVVLFCALIIGVLRYAMNRSALLGRILIAGTLVHAVVTAALFTISWFNLPVVRALHTGDGFSTLAMDAKVYYELAASAAREGLHVILPGSASPIFVAIVAIWMDLVGVYPWTPLLLNLVVFVLVGGLLVRMTATSGHTGSTEAGVWPLTAWSFSPTLLFCSTQILKDLLFAAMIVLAFVSTRALLINATEGGRLRKLAAPLTGALIGLWIGVYVIAGVRTYYAVILWVTLAAVIVLLMLWRRGTIWRHVVIGGLALAVAGTALTRGAGPYYLEYRDVVVATLDSATGGLASALSRKVADPGLPAPSSGAPVKPNVAEKVDAMREGFVRSGGRTNVVPMPSEAEVTEVTVRPGRGDSAGGPRWPAIRAKAAALALGLAAIFVPVSVLQELSLVEIKGGRGLLYISDLDTLFIDVTILGVLLLLRRDRYWTRQHRAYLWFCLLIAIISVVLLAYIVTNLGTLFRLRLIAIVPIWLAPLAISRGIQEAASPAAATSWRRQLAATGGRPAAQLDPVRGAHG